MPILSMLDLLFGAFGAMIVIAVMLTFLRTQESRIAQEALYSVVLQISGVEPGAEIDLSRVFFEFEYTGADGKETVWSPLKSLDEPAMAPEFVYASANRENSSIALELPSERIPKKGQATLRANLQNLPALKFDQAKSLNAATLFRLSLVIQTAFNACALEGTMRLEELLAADAEAPERAPSAFDLLAVESKDGRLICEFSGDNDDRGATFEVNNGQLLITVD